MDNSGPIIMQTRDERNPREENGVLCKTAFLLFGGLTIIGVPLALLITPVAISFNSSATNSSVTNSSEGTITVSLYFIQNSVLLILVLWDWTEMWILAWNSRKINVEYKRNLKLMWLNAIMILMVHICIMAVLLLCFKKLDGVEAESLSNLTYFTIMGVEFHILLHNVSVMCKMFKLYRNHIDPGPFPSHDFESSSNVRYN